MINGKTKTNLTYLEKPVYMIHYAYNCGGI